MDSPELVLSSHQGGQTVLIIDKNNTLGEDLAKHLEKDVSVVLVSSKLRDTASHIIHVPFKTTVPQIPEGEYSHIFVVWDNDGKDLLQPLFEEARNLRAKIICIADASQKKSLEEETAPYRNKVTLLFLGDIFSEKSGEYELDRWLYEIKQTGKIKLENMGLDVFYPVLYEDIFPKIISCAFSHVVGGEVFLVCSQHPYTKLALSHILQKDDPLIHIDFSSQKAEEKENLPVGTFLFEKEYAVVAKIKTAYEEIPLKKERTGGAVSQPAQKTSRKKPQDKKSYRMLFPLYLIFLMLFMPIVLTFGLGGLGAFFLRSGVEDIKKGNISLAANTLNTAAQTLTLSLNAANILSWEAIPFGQRHNTSFFVNQLTTGLSVTNGMQEVVSSYQKLSGVLMGKSLTPNEDTTEGVNTLKNSIEIFQTVNAKNLPVQYAPLFSAYQNDLSEISSVIDSLPSIIGATGERKYLVLFQNNMELRPGGGFIGSYGIISLHNGKIEDFSIHDVYQADGQLKGHVEPPFAIRRYLPSVHLFLRDSNFDVDFTKDAQEAAFLLSQETGDKVDGVIGIDLSFVRNLLGSVGSVYVPSYNQTVTKDNFFLLTEKYAEKNTFAGSTQKQDFLHALFVAIEGKIASKNISFSSNTLQLLFNSLSQKDVVVSFADPITQAPFVYAGFTSSLWDGRANAPDTINDFLGIREANLGVNKANYFVQRMVSHSVSITDGGQVSEKVDLSLTNTSKKGEWPGGVYKNYLRFILPLNSSLQGISLNGVNQKMIPAITDAMVYEAKHFAPPQGLEIEKTQEEGKDVYGFLVNVPEQNTLTIHIAYTLAQKVSLSDPTLTYSLRLFKQPGIDSLPYSLHIDYPASFRLLSSSSEATKGDGSVALSTNVTTDSLFNFSFTQK